MHNLATVQHSASDIFHSNKNIKNYGGKQKRKKKSVQIRSKSESNKKDTALVIMNVPFWARYELQFHSA